LRVLTTLDFSDQFNSLVNVKWGWGKAKLKISVVEIGRC